MIVGFFSMPAEARGNCGWFGCGGGDDTEVVVTPTPVEEVKTTSPAEKEKQAARIAKSIADFKAKNIPDLDKLHPGLAKFLGVNKKVETETCWKEGFVSWVRVEVTCPVMAKDKDIQL